ncbi:MAG: sulfatase-like hydrolase/transferase [Verrucomicrobiales bacterium]|nr:sulfatase-like hydrolase/transferase [Verrucomicrobiales bacterium]
MAVVYWTRGYISIKCSASAELGADQLRCQVLTYLKGNGLEDYTIVIYSSDQGFFVGEHGWYDKRWMYEPSMRTPLIVCWPGVLKPGSICRNLVQNIDIAPGILMKWKIVTGIRSVKR